MEKNEVQISSLEVTKKVPSPLKMFFFLKKKKILKLICVDMIFKRVCGIFFLDQWVLGYLRFRKVVLHNKIINKIRLTNNQVNSTHCFGDNSRKTSSAR